MTTSLIEDKMKDKTSRAHTRQNPERHIPLVSLLLRHKMVAVHCFVWLQALQIWSVSRSVGRSVSRSVSQSVSQAGRQVKIQDWEIF